MALRYWLVCFALALTCAGCDQGKSNKDKRVKKEGASKTDGKAGSSCKDDGDCKNGFLCEAKVCIPEVTAKKARAAGKPVKASSNEASNDSKAAVPAAACGSASDIPAIPATKSDPPGLAEWASACSVNTQGANSQAPDCTSKIKREWLQVTCRGGMLGYEKMDGFGVEGHDYFKQIKPGKFVSFVLRLRKGQSQKVRMCRKKERASLFVSWPPSSPKPTIVAVGRGPKCDGSKWGTTH